MNIKTLFYIVVMALLVGCSKPQDKPAYPGKVVDEHSGEVEEPLTLKEQSVLLKEFYDLLIENADEDTIVKFVDEHIGSLDTENADDMILEMEDYLLKKSFGFEHTYDTASKYIDHASDEVKSYFELLKAESQNVYTDGDNLNIGVEELLNRALNAEKHLKDYPTGKTNKKAYEMYENYIYGAILGSGNQYIYANESSSIIKDEVLKVYNEIIDKDNGTYTAKILTQYVDELSKDNGDLNGQNTLYFYENIHEIIHLNSK
ncbi:hypothetical protein [Paratissierella segnis]|jgi:hypothetical protein|uniref:Lipoprotein n=1 Tax=Paratissierella segnis TaxID=2763679 RepID=A0A926ERG4_9FIRM|nr:hypothetical protein [Paratissierella segnis]MBC8587165.1 hypothetical protein [Paratissierella segnis]